VGRIIVQQHPSFPDLNMGIASLSLSGKVPELILLFIIEAIIYMVLWYLHNASIF